MRLSSSLLAPLLLSLGLAACGKKAEPPTPVVPTPVTATSAADTAEPAKPVADAGTAAAAADAGLAVPPKGDPECHIVSFSTVAPRPAPEASTWVAVWNALDITPPEGPDHEPLPMTSEDAVKELLTKDGNGEAPMVVPFLAHDVQGLLVHPLPTGGARIVTFDSAPGDSPCVGRSPPEVIRQGDHLVVRSQLWFKAVSDECTEDFGRSTFETIYDTKSLVVLARVERQDGKHDVGSAAFRTTIKNNQVAFGGCGEGRVFTLTPEDKDLEPEPRPAPKTVAPKPVPAGSCTFIAGAKLSQEPRPFATWLAFSKAAGEDKAAASEADAMTHAGIQGGKPEQKVYVVDDLPREGADIRMSLATPTATGVVAQVGLWSYPAAGDNLCLTQPEGNVTVRREGGFDYVRVVTWELKADGNIGSIDDCKLVARTITEHVLEANTLRLVATSSWRDSTRSIDTAAYKSELVLPAGWSLNGCGDTRRVSFE